MIRFDDSSVEDARVVEEESAISQVERQSRRG